MRHAIWGAVRLCALAAVPSLLLSAAAPAEDQSGKGLSDRFVRVLQGIAWDRMPERLEIDGQESIELDKSDPQEFLLPEDDARRVIVLSDRSATAALCELEEEAVANFITMMNAERDRGQWTREQLHMIKWIYLAVMEVRTTHWEVKEDQGASLDHEEAARIAQDQARRGRQDFDCTDEMRDTVREEILDFVRTAGASSG